MSQNLQSEHRARCYLALRGLVVLGKNPLMAEKMGSLTESLVELLEENDSDMVRMTILLLRYLLLDNGAPIPTPIALQLAEALLPLFDCDDSQVQLSSMCVFQEMLDLLMQEGRKALKSHVCQSLLPLYFHCHDENQLVAEASREMLHSSARFLKRRDLDQVLQVDQTWRFGESLLAEDRSRAAEHLRRALRYLQSPQEPLREAAIRFMGMAGQHLRGKKEELQLICSALEHLTEDISSVMSDMAYQTLCVLQALQSERYTLFQRLQDQFHRSGWAGAGAAGIPARAVPGDGHEPFARQEAPSVSSCPCAAGWIAEGSEVPLARAPLELLWGCGAAAGQLGRAGGDPEGTGHREALSNWVSEAISSPLAAALLLLELTCKTDPGRSGTNSISVVGNLWGDWCGMQRFRDITRQPI
ncbi:uncharacterized protein LOC108963754 [Serinus canaria]|uniref:uncharacterized protein LOC108963754 n=1 Tax=Serinus canaria TaxID=9135 RepID=UPI0021CCDE56|nr:uncharacterized protein LOC108963754 [Serinus canaria]